MTVLVLVIVGVMLGVLVVFLDGVQEALLYCLLQLEIGPSMTQSAPIL